MSETWAGDILAATCACGCKNRRPHGKVMSPACWERVPPEAQRAVYKAWHAAQGKNGGWKSLHTRLAWMLAVGDAVAALTGKPNTVEARWTRDPQNWPPDAVWDAT